MILPSLSHKCLGTVLHQKDQVQTEPCSLALLEEELAVVVFDALAEVNIASNMVAIAIIKGSTKNWDVLVAFDLECHVFGTAREV